MGLQPLEFSECLTDSPYFRENLHAHEKELERTSKAIKGLIGEVKDLLNAAKNLSKAQRNFSNTLIDFRFDCIGVEQTDDEITIGNALKEFGRLIALIEDERDRMLDRAFDQIIHPLENFRKEQIGGAKEGKKKFDRQTTKFCQSLEKYLNLKTKNSDGILQDADAALEMEKRHFYQASMQYVLLLQEVQERKKFEFVETLLGFMYGWFTFYHQGHDVSTEFKPYMTELQMKLQKCRENFATTHEKAETLMNKMLEVRGTKPHEHAPPFRRCTKEGYLFIMEKSKYKALPSTWTKYYCLYQKENKILTMIPYNQIAGKGISTETVVLNSCTRRASDSIEKRFCFDITTQGDKSSTLTLQALSEDDFHMWLDAMDGKEPIYSQPAKQHELDSLLDDIGFTFIKKCISAIETRGLTDEGLYRVVGVSSKVSKLTAMGLDRRKIDKLNLEDSKEMEVKTITSALKNYFRSLPEPIMTYRLHEKFIAAAKQESKTLRVNDIHALVHQLPEANFEMLDLLVKHLKRVSDHSDKNLMPIANVGVCFGPTLMRPEEESMAAIMDIKFCNIVVEILIENNEKIFGSAPADATDITQTKVVNSGQPVTAPQPQRPERPPKIMSSSYTAGSNSSNNSNGGGSNQTTPQATPQQGHHRRDSTGSMNTSTTSGMGSSISSNGGTGYTYGSSTNAGQTYAQYRARLRPTGGIYSQFSPGEHHSSTSSSSESLNSKCSGLNQSNPSLNTTPTPGSDSRQSSNTGAVSSVPPGSNINRYSQPSLGSSRPDQGSSTSSISSVSSGTAQTGRRKVRTLYSCEAENDAELSFEPNQIIHNVRTSREPGWLEGTLDGKTGLIPANYVEYVN